MISKKIFTSLLMSIMSFGFVLDQSFASSTNPLVIVNGNVTYKSNVPTNLLWGDASLAASRQAINFQTREIETAISKLTKKGAVRVIKTFAKTSTSAYPDWKTYVPTFSQYVLSGLNASGKVVGRSLKLPSDSANLANRLVYLKQSECSPKGADSRSSLPACMISKPKIENYLRAALRTSLGNGQVEDLGGHIGQQLFTCLRSKRTFTVKNGIFDCPSNAKIFGGDRSFPVKGDFATRSYSIKFSSTKQTATMTYGPRNYSKLALTGKYDYGSVVRFG